MSEEEIIYELELEDIINKTLEEEFEYNLLSTDPKEIYTAY